MSNPQNQDTVPNQTVIIVINGREVPVPKGKVTYEVVVGFAYPNPDFQNNIYKVTYFRKNDHHEGTLAKGQSVEVTKDMVFTVIPAIRS